MAESAPVIDSMAPILIVAGALAAGVEAVGVVTEVVVAVDVVEEQPERMRPNINNTPRNDNKKFFIMITSFKLLILHIQRVT